MDSVKDRVQHEALARWELAGRKGTLAMGTGSGKSRIPLLRIEELYEELCKDLRVLIATPTEELRDVTWPSEAKKWDVDRIYNEVVEGVCYASLAKKPKGHYHLVVLDEGHHITEANIKFLENITYDEIMVLTATVPKKGTERDTNKSMLLDSIAPVVFTYNIDTAIGADIIADYEIFVVEMPLDDTVKTIPGGNKKNRFMTTESRAYDFMNRKIMTMLMSNNPKKDVIIPMLFNKRAKFMTDLPSKRTVAKLLLDKVLEDKKTIVFGGSINQINYLCSPNVYHSKTDDSALKKFMAGEIQVLGAVKALDEGVNLPDLDQAVIIQLTSKERQLVQRIGRTVRKRPGHKARIFILVVTGTVDEEWSKKALKAFDPAKIFYVSYKNFL